MNQETPPKFHRKAYFHNVIRSYIKNRCTKCYMDIFSELTNKIHSMTGHSVTKDENKIQSFIQYFANHKGLKIEQGVIYSPNMPSKPLFGKFFPLLTHLANREKKKDINGYSPMCMPASFEFWFRTTITSEITQRRSSYYTNMTTICLVTTEDRLHIPSFFQVLSHYLMKYCRALKSGNLKTSTATQFLDTMQLTIADIKTAYDLSHNLYSHSKKHGVRFCKMAQVLEQEYVYCYFQYLSNFDARDKKGMHHVPKVYTQIYKALLHLINPEFKKQLDKKLNMFAHNVANNILDTSD